MQNKVQVRFLGASGMVTGSCYLVDTAHGSFMVDCGMFQGTKTVRELNYGKFNFDPEKDVDCLLLTHAHIDHSGLIPKLIKHGYKGPVYATEATKDLLRIMLPDSGYIQETEVKYVNRKNAQRGLPAVEPIYTKHDAINALDYIKSVDFREWIEPLPGVRARYWNAGHILGSASIEVEIDGAGRDGAPMKMLFSGDIGPHEKAFHPDPEAPSGIDYLFVESTYGDRDRDDDTMVQRRKALSAEINSAMQRGGNLVIPAFAVERTQEILYDIDVLIQEKAVPASLKVFLDSPLASKATEIFRKHKAELEDIHGGKPFSGSYLKITESVAESKQLNNLAGGAIIIAASGMCEAGRIRHHLKNNLWNPSATVLFTGYQAPGSLGRLIKDGAQHVRIHGQEIRVRATVSAIETYSAHADQPELVKWVLARAPVSSGIFIVHGEDGPREIMSGLLAENGIAKKLIMQPDLDDCYELAVGEAPQRTSAPVRIKDDGQETRMDWHNEYAELLLQLAEDLRDLPTVEARRALLDEVRNTMRSKREKAA